MNQSHLQARNLTDLEYRALSDLYNEFQDAFRALPSEIQVMFYKRLYHKN